jgi:hypothetical protein
MSSRRRSSRVSAKEKGSIVAGSAGKKTSFDDDENDDDFNIGNIHSADDNISSRFRTSIQKQNMFATEDSDDDAPPEEISANSIAIQQLKALHEQIAVGKNKRKRKARPQRLQNDDEELDESILAALEGNGEVADGSTDGEDVAPTKIPTRIDKNKRSKRV